MLKSFARRMSGKLGNVLKLIHDDDTHDKDLEEEKNLYKRHILRHARTIHNFEEDYNISDIVEAIENLVNERYRVGRLAYAGGPPATRCAGVLLETLGCMLNGIDVKCEIKIAILKTLSIITIGNVEHQDRCEAYGILNDVVDIIQDNLSPDAMTLWACYCLHSMIVGNINCMECIANMPGIGSALHQAELLDWNPFVRNYAADVTKLIGFTKSIPLLLQPQDNIKYGNEIPPCLPIKDSL